MMYSYGGHLARCEICAVYAYGKGHMSHLAMVL